jgi:enoyl-CoA hydratase/carnithine racemase
VSEESQTTHASRRETGTPEILCELRDRVATITLNRPEAKNALTMDMKQALYVLVRDLE